MERRTLYAGGPAVGAIGLGCWQLGGDWGEVDDDTAVGVLRAAARAGTTFYDTADVYGDGRSEATIGRFLASGDAPADVVVATKMGRRAPLDPAEYTLENFRAWTDRSRANLGVDTLDLVQLHCPPTEVYYRPEVFAALRTLVDDGAIRRFGVSVEKVEEGLVALEHEGLATIQVIFNPFRQRPAERLLTEAAARGVGIIVRVPLASGLLSGKYGADTTFGADDHRRFNRHGEAFDVGETFAGVPFETGLEAVEELRPLVPEGATMAQLALRWILDHEAVSVVIPGARNPDQAQANAAAGDVDGLDAEAHERIAAVYRERVAPHVHLRW
jgi:aryl-alcohol dehydrogenase-like predicted oxidoreductase